jgi:hypothetical protein
MQKTWCHLEIYFGGKRGGNCFGGTYGLVFVESMVLWWEVWCCGGTYMTLWQEAS